MSESFISRHFRELGLSGKTSWKSVFQELMKFRPDQPRDDSGRFSSGGGSFNMSEVQNLPARELKNRGFIPVFRGTGPQGLQNIRPSSEGQLGPGVYFYGDPYNASTYAESGGGVITGFVHPDDVKVEEIPGSMFSRPHKVIVLPDPDRFIRRGTIPTEDTTGNYEERLRKGEEALDKIPGK